MYKVLKYKVLSILFFFVIKGYGQVDSQPYEGLDEWSKTKDHRMEWFRKARFGMFIHWGLYSAAGGSWQGKQYPQHYAEWIQTWATVPSKSYATELKPKFTADKLNANEWATLAKNAGMQYVVLTSRHHEGFSLFNSKQPFSVSNTITGGTNISPKGRDLYAEIAHAFHRKGLKVGAYYSLLDWQHPDSYEGKQFNSELKDHIPDRKVYKEYLYQQIKELATNYGKLDILWLDFSSKNRQGETWGTKRILKDLLKWQPDIIVNNRFWNGLENKNGDIGTPEKYIPPTGLPGMDWEVSHTMNESYGFSNHDSKWKSYDQIMRLFLETVSKGGNFLLNVGPDAAGTIPGPAVELLRRIGDWMKINSESIYGTSASPFQTLDLGYCTQKNGKLYFHIFNRPPGGKLSIPLSSPVKRAYPLESPGTALKVHKELETTVISLPEDNKTLWPQVIVAEITGQPKVSESTVQTSSDGRIVLTANNAKLRGNGGIKLVGATTHDPNRPNAIGNWSLATDQAYWDIKVQRPGSYNLVISYLPNKKMGGTIEIALGSQKISHKIPLGDENKFIEKKIGILEIDQRLLGETNVKLKLSLAEVNGDQLPEISSIILVPIN